MYNTGRVNMGGCDFSERPYTLAETPGDTELNSFSLAEEDLDLKVRRLLARLRLKANLQLCFFVQIPIIKRANALRGKDLHLFASPWTAPPWMKNNSDYTGFSYLLPEYYPTWANYFVK